MSTMTARVSVTRAETKFTVTVQLMDCANCGVVFAVPEEFDSHRREDGKGFYCPNGHTLSYDSEASKREKKLRDDLRRAENRAQWAEDSERLARDRAREAEGSLRATKGVVTKLRKRAHAGTCPFGCRRHFVDLERHVASKHPGQQLDGES